MQDLARLLEMLISCQDVTRQTCFHSRLLLALLLPFQHVSKNCQHTMFKLPVKVRKNLMWWKIQERLAGGSQMGELTWKIVMTNASLLGWGPHMEGVLAQGTWTPEEVLTYVNVLEHRAIRGPDQRESCSDQTDNVMAKTFINKQGGTRSSRLSAEVALLFQWEEPNLQTIRAEHLAYMMVDWLSRRHLLESEWQLNPQVFSQAIQKFGSLVVDLFTTAENRQVYRHFSRGPQDGVEALDTLLNLGMKGLLCAFHHSDPVSATKDKAAEGRSRPNCMWFPELLCRSIQTHWMLLVRGDWLL